MTAHKPVFKPGDRIVAATPDDERYHGLRGTVANYSALHDDYLVQFDDRLWNMVWLGPEALHPLSLLEILAEESR